MQDQVLIWQNICNEAEDTNFGETLLEDYCLLFIYLLIYALLLVGMGPSWLSIEHDHPGITAHPETAATFNVCETLNLDEIFTQQQPLACLSITLSLTCHVLGVGSQHVPFFKSLVGLGRDPTHNLPHIKRTL